MLRYNFVSSWWNPGFGHPSGRGKIENRKNINKIGGNICGDRILCRVDETQVSDTPADEEKLKIALERVPL